MFNIFEKLRRFDAYPKTLEDVRIKTYGGAVVTIISLTIMTLLFWVELVDYLTPNVSEELFVDTSRSPSIQINLDIIVPTISCDFLALDAMDSSGEQHLQIDHNIYKRRLDLQGQPIEEPKKEDITIKRKNSTEVATVNKTECGSCYGASFDPKRCCNTCEDVREAYRERRWAFPENPENITQCKEERFSEKLKTAFAQGCQIYGSLTVNRVSGSFHIAPGKSFSINHVHVHDVQPFSSTEFNTTHKIRHLSFGASIDSDTHNPLKDTVGLAEEGASMFQYHIKIVPTAYVKLDGQFISANQFSVTKHRRVISLMSGESGMPGIFFQYELSPLMVKYTEQSRSFGHFATNVCAIIGGVYTVAGLIDTMLYHSVKLIQKKIELGKFH
ncbi:endoplasmic reticulum-Golgi intermediate compartment protein 3 [Tribolium castaneum]|uniref:Endoplasmic reticulum-Golgi intermediate compartment protein 3 n=1 Tax=Tribolium castaneum TaxID=7070 RepID=D6WNW2_TRICA|nr:PREDICTED: endoplasmic reticulum-Golgi intermediate compartment protein 3 [Tribolium castaneum]EFA04394.1 Endoplasmic reticulum-Golgi intermediate compartment protein 3-like Protein [Tribolium castaneum]|eukprot:XP_008194346.1 PREDICTED: endoplasmic reticulum-Golgi intermediate compartment protein 3 [Tribolium castaneum]